MDGLVTLQGIPMAENEIIKVRPNLWGTYQ